MIDDLPGHIRVVPITLASTTSKQELIYGVICNLLHNHKCQLPYMSYHHILPSLLAMQDIAVCVKSSTEQW